MGKKAKPRTSKKISQWKKGVARAKENRQAAHRSDTLLQNALSSLQGGNPEEAEKILQMLLKNPKESPAHLNGLGILAHMLGHSRIGLDLLRKSVKLEATAPSLNNLGLALEQLGSISEAEISYTKALENDPRFAPAHFNLGNIFQKKLQHQDAVDAYRKAIRLKHDYAAAYNNMANAQIGLGKLKEAEDSCLTALKKNPDYAEAIHTWCNVMLKKESRKNIVALVDKRFAFLPHKKNIVYGILGDIFADLGEKQQAVSSYRKTLEESAQRGKIFLRMSMLKNFQAKDTEILEMEEEYARSDKLQDKHYLCFALGKAYEETGEYSKAFRFIEEGNKLVRATYAYSVEEDIVFFDKVKTTFDGKFLLQSGNRGCRNNSPIFIVGMPRSGTTLVEQILASHSNVYGAGELPELDFIIRKTLQQEGIQNIPEGIKKINPQKIISIGQEYIAFTKRLASDGDRIVDKMPHNFVWLGMIHLALPKAKIIHCRRDPMDTCWSIYKNIFDIPHKYAQNQVELGKYYRIYMDLMDHWKETMPENMYEIEYEKLIRNQENETRGLLKYCGLPWEEQCLNFHRSERRVLTSSMSQVRKPLYASSIKKWTYFAQELKPLSEIITG